MSIGRWMEKKAVVHTHMEYYSAIKKNALESVLTRWMKLDPIIQGGKSERETQRQYINVHIWNLERWWWWPYMRDTERDTDVKNRLLDSGRRWGWDDLREWHWNMYISIRKTDDQCKFIAWSRAPKASAVGQSRGMRWGGRGEGAQDGGDTHIHPWLIHVNVWQKLYCKVIILQLK